MKPIIPFALLGALFAVGTASAATTTPVGYITVNIPANADSTISAPLAQAPLLSTASTGIAGNVISFTSSGVAADAFVNVGSPHFKTYVLIKSGPLSGKHFPVTANTTGTVTVDTGAGTLQAQGFVTGNTFEVVPFWTLATLFPGGAGVGGSNDIFDPTSFLLVSDQASTGPNRGAGAVYFYGNGADSTTPAWRNANDPEGPLANNVTIDPSIMYTIRTGPTPQTVTVTGEVPKVALATTLLTATQPNDEDLAVRYPVDTTLAESGLQSALVAASDPFDPTEFVFVYDDAAAGFNKGASATYFYYDGTSGGTAGWKDNNAPDGPNVTAPVLKAGRAIVVRKAPGAAATTTWTSPLPYTP
ncbi:MAG TPA: TIGR02597 family protein [Haloferula sp.]